MGGWPGSRSREFTLKRRVPQVSLLRPGITQNPNPSPSSHQEVGCPIQNAKRFGWGRTPINSPRSVILSTSA